jgi:hypothetical protein
MLVREGEEAAKISPKKVEVICGPDWAKLAEVGMPCGC